MPAASLRHGRTTFSVSLSSPVRQLTQHGDDHQQQDDLLNMATTINSNTTYSTWRRPSTERRPTQHGEDHQQQGDLLNMATTISSMSITFSLATTINSKTTYSTWRRPSAACRSPSAWLHACPPICLPAILFTVASCCLPVHQSACLPIG